MVPTMAVSLLLLLCLVVIVHSKNTGDQVFSNYDGLSVRTQITPATDWYYAVARKKGGHLKDRWSSKSMESKKRRKSECSQKHGKVRLANFCNKRKKEKDKSKSMKQVKGKGSSSSSKGFVTPFPTISQPSVTTPLPTFPSKPAVTPPPAMLETLAPAIVLPPVDIVPPPKEKTDPPIAVPLSPPTLQPIEAPLSPTSAPMSEAPPTAMSQTPLAPPTTASPVPKKTSSPTVAPSTMITVTPSPIVQPTNAPTSQQATTPPFPKTTSSPMAQPTNAPTSSPTTAPPTVAPVTPGMPTSSPVLPMETPTDIPTQFPKKAPTGQPTLSPKSAPTISPTVQPVSVTDAPIMPLPPTASPTIQQTTAPTFTLEIQSTPFEIIYKVDGDVGFDSFKDFGEAQIATLEFLEAYFFEIFGERDGTDLESFAGEVIESDPDIPSASYFAEFFFAPTSTFVPSQVELDFLIEAAFTEEPYRSDFLSRMANLGPDNVFSTTSDVLYLPRSDLAVDNRNGDKKDGLKLNYTSYGEAPLKITPFTIDYNTDDREPTLNDTIQAVHLTLSFLDEYFQASFDSAFPGSYQFLVGSGRPSATDSTKIGYLVGIHASQNAVNSVSQQDLDEEVEMAFVTPAVDALLLILKALPNENPFSTTTSVTFQTLPGLDDPDSEQQFSTVMISLVVIGGCIFTVALICVVDLRTKKGLRNKLVGPDIVLTIDGRNQYDIVSDCSGPSAENRLPHISEESDHFNSEENSWAKEYDGETIEFDLTKEFIKRKETDPLARPP